jgi:hypothetical protein
MRADVPPLPLWDASDLAERYVSEVGSSTANALFVSDAHMAAAFSGYPATYTTLLRRPNDGRLAAPSPLP